MKASDFFTAQQKTEIVEAIKTAEHETSGEIRVHIELKCKGDVLDRAAKVFAMLKMHKTQLRNGILFYLAVENQKFAVIGDAGINKVVHPEFWKSIKDAMEEFFKQGKFTEGLVHGILSAGEQLKAFFRYEIDDVNELSDDISFGKEEN
jgi:uncharacterized membrane protein